MQHQLVLPRSDAVGGCVCAVRALCGRTPSPFSSPNVRGILTSSSPCDLQDSRTLACPRERFSLGHGSHLAGRAARPERRLLGSAVLSAPRSWDRARRALTGAGSPRQRRCCVGRLAAGCCRWAPGQGVRACRCPPSGVALGRSASSALAVAKDGANPGSEPPSSSSGGAVCSLDRKSQLPSRGSAAVAGEAGDQQPYPSAPGTGGARERLRGRGRRPARCCPGRRGAAWAGAAPAPALRGLGPAARPGDRAGEAGPRGGRGGAGRARRLAGGEPAAPIGGFV